MCVVMLQIPKGGRVIRAYELQSSYEKKNTPRDCLVNKGVLSNRISRMSVVHLHVDATSESIKFRMCAACIVHCDGVPPLRSAVNTPIASRIRPCPKKAAACLQLAVSQQAAEAASRPA